MGERGTVRERKNSNEANERGGRGPQNWKQMTDAGSGAAGLLERQGQSKGSESRRWSLGVSERQGQSKGCRQWTQWTKPKCHMMRLRLQLKSEHSESTKHFVAQLQQAASNQSRANNLLLLQ